MRKGQETLSPVSIELVPLQGRTLLTRCRAPNQQLTTDSAGNPQWTSEAGSPPQAPNSQVAERVPELSMPPHRAPDQMAAKPNRPAEQDPFVKRRAQDEDVYGGAPVVKKHQSVSPSTAYGHPAASSAQPPYPHHLDQRFPPPSKGSGFMSWEEDPFASDPSTTIHLLETYFAHVNSATYCMFPRVTFMNWLTTSRSKCQNECVVLYALLAMGSVFAGQDYASVGKKCAALATEGLATKVGRFSLPVIHVRLVLALYNFAKGNEGAAWDYCGLAIRALSALRTNHEEGCLISPKNENPILEYGLTRDQVAECRRRTFWAGFLMDRYNGFCGGMLCVINPADIYLRLPCAEDAYESGAISAAPFYNNGTVDRTHATLNASSPVSPMAWLVVVGGIWGDAMNFIYRAANHNPNTYRQAYEKVYHDTHTAIQEWNSQLPGYLQFSEANLDRSIQGGYAGTYISLHVLHHFVIMKLNRCMRHTLVADLAPRNIRTAHYHAHRLLGVMRAVRDARREIIHPKSGQPSRFEFSVPFPGYATLAAVDVVGGGGPDSTLSPTVNGMESGLDCLRELARYWNSAVDQSRSGERRLLQLKNVLSRPYKASSGCWLGRNWGLEGPLEQEFELDADCIYGVDNTVYFNALEDDATNGRSRA
jgi:hypothetical protein